MTPVVMRGDSGKALVENCGTQAAELGGLDGVTSAKPSQRSWKRVLRVGQKQLLRCRCRGLRVTQKWACACSGNDSASRMRSSLRRPWRRHGKHVGTRSSDRSSFVKSPEVRMILHCVGSASTRGVDRGMGLFFHVETFFRREGVNDVR